MNHIFEKGLLGMLGTFGDGSLVADLVPRLGVGLGLVSGWVGDPTETIGVHKPSMLPARQYQGVCDFTLRIMSPGRPLNNSFPVASVSETVP